MRSTSGLTNAIELSRISQAGGAQSSVAVFIAIFLLVISFMPDYFEAQFGIAGAVVILAAMAFTIERFTRPAVLWVIGWREYGMLKKGYGQQFADFVADHYARGGALDEYQFRAAAKRYGASANGEKA